MISINAFYVRWEGPYPCWVVIQHHGKEIARFHHKELKDLEYALHRVRQQIAAALPEKDKHEA